MAPATVKISKYAALTAANAIIHTVYKGRVFHITMIHLVNTTAVDVTVRLNLVPQLEAVSQANAILWDYTIPAHDFIEFGEGFYLLTEGTVQGYASAANAVNIQLSGTEE